MKITYEEIPYPPDIFPEIATLLPEHKKEACLFGDVELDVNWEGYRKMADMGMLHVVFARTETGELVGYTVNFIIRHLHYNFIMSTNDIIYMKPKYRGHATKLIKFTEERLIEKGVNIYVLSIKPHIDFSPVVERFGYKHLESNYWRRLQ